MTEPRKLLDMLILGLYWLNEEREDIYPRRAGMVFRTLHSMKIISHNERLVISSGTHPITNLAITDDMLILRVRQKPRQPKLQNFAAESDKLLITLNKGAMLKYSRLFGGDGYVMFLTAKGETYARSIAAEYADILTKEAFLKAWPEACAAIGRQMGHLKKRQSQGLPVSAPQQRNGAMPNATVSEENWEW